MTEILLFKLFLSMMTIFVIFFALVITRQSIINRGFSNYRIKGSLWIDSVMVLKKIKKYILNRLYHPKHLLFLFLLYLFPLVSFVSIRFFNPILLNNHLIDLNLLKVETGVIGTLNLLYIGFIIYSLVRIFSQRQIAAETALKAAVNICYSYITYIIVFLTVIVTYKTISYDGLTEIQSGMVLEFIPYWGFIIQPVSGVIFLITTYIFLNNLFSSSSEIQDSHSDIFFIDDSLDYIVKHSLRNISEIVLITIFCFLFLGGSSLPKFIEVELGANSILFIILQFFTVLLKIVFMGSVLTAMKKFMPEFKNKMIVKVLYNYCLTVSILMLGASTLIIKFWGS